MSQKFSVALAFALTMCLAGCGAKSGPPFGDVDSGLEADASPGHQDGPSSGADGVLVKGRNGTSCTSADHCESGVCVGGVCCNEPCAGACRSCHLGSNYGVCTPVPAGWKDPGGVCAKEAVESCGHDGTCDGSGACRKYPQGTPCKAGSCVPDSVDRALPATCDGSGACVPGPTQSCAPYACADGACKMSCASKQDCSAENSCVGGSCGKLPLGAPCTAGTQCASESCIDGVCCDTAVCNGPCRACNLPARLGTCSPIAANADARAPGCPMDAPASCGRTGKCDGKGDCQALAPVGTICGVQSCAAATESAPPACDGMGACLPGATRSCGAFACKASACGRTCAIDTDCIAEAYCREGVCTMRQASGSACAATRECKSGFCTDGVCCEVACTEPCRRCAAGTGQCQPLTTGRDTNSTPPCGGPRRCSPTGTCE